MKLNSSLQALHERALALAREHRQLESQLVDVLGAIDSSQLYRKLGYSSLFVYAVSALGMSESTAYAFITVTRKSKTVAPLKEALVAGRLSVAKASRIASAVTAENASMLIAFAAEHTARETDREVARLNGKSSTGKRRPLAVSTEVLELLRRAQSLLASRKKRDVRPEEALALVLEDYLERHDPVKKAERAHARKRLEVPANSVRSELTAVEAVRNSDPTESPRSERRPLPAASRHQVTRRHQGRCAFVDASGQRCPNERWLEIHHLRPVSLGGSDEPENLTLLCSFHHDRVHQLSFPIEGQVNWLRATDQAYWH